MDEPLYTGKAKSLYETADPDVLMMLFRDDISAFDGDKKQRLVGKGVTNNRINAYIMRYLRDEGMATAFVAQTDIVQSLVWRLEMFPVECIVRNKAAGSFCKRYGTENGKVFKFPLLEWCVKDDLLHDPMITKQGVQELFGISEYDIGQMQNMAYLATRLLTKLFGGVGLDLVDIKYEFGKHKNEIYLGDEITPDSMRLWDMETGDIKDKDVYRKDLGDTVAAYEEVMNRLGA